MTVKLMRANYDCEAGKNCAQTYYLLNLSPCKYTQFSREKQENREESFQ